MLLLPIFHSRFTHKFTHKRLIYRSIEHIVDSIVCFERAFQRTNEDPRAISRGMIEEILVNERKLEKWREGKKIFYLLFARIESNFENKRGGKVERSNASAH